MKKYYYYTYKTTNNINNKYYIGVHKSVSPHDKSYCGSGTRIKNALIKYGKENFSVEILAYYDSLADAYDAEFNLITEKMIASDECYNMQEGGKGGNDGKRFLTPENIARMKESPSQEVRDKISASLMGKCYLTDGGRERIIESLKGNSRAKGMTYIHTDEAKEAIAESKRGVAWTQERRAASSIARKGIYQGELNPMASEENRNKVRDSKIGLKALSHTEKPKRMAKPGSDKWNQLVEDGYLPV